MRIPSVILFVSAAFFVSAAKPPSGSGTSSPEVVFTETNRNGVRNLKVSNEDGTGAVTLYSTSNQLYPEFGPRAQKQIAFWDAGTLRLLTYDAGSNGVERTSVETLTTSGRSWVSPFEFSQTGTHIVWWHPEELGLYVYDLTSRTQQRLMTVSGHVSDLTITRDGQTIIYAEHIGGESDTGNYVLRSVPLTGGTPAELGISGYIIKVDAGHTDDRLLVTKQINGVGRHLELFGAGSTTGTRITDGENGSFNCNDERGIYRYSPDRTGKTLKYDFTSGLTSTFTKQDNIIFVSYVPTC